MSVREPLDLRLQMPGAAAAIRLLREAEAAFAVVPADLAAGLALLRGTIERDLVTARDAATPMDEDMAPVRFAALEPTTLRHAFAVAAAPAELRRFIDGVACIAGTSQAISGGNWTEAMTAVALGRLRTCIVDPRLRVRLTLLVLLEPRLAQALRLLLREAARSAGPRPDR